MIGRSPILSLSLKESAVDSLATAIDYYCDEVKPAACNYAIMFAGHAAEL